MVLDSGIFFTNSSNNPIELVDDDDDDSDLRDSGCSCQDRQDENCCIHGDIFETDVLFTPPRLNRNSRIVPSAPRRKRSRHFSSDRDASECFHLRKKIKLLNETIAKQNKQIMELQDTMLSSLKDQNNQIMELQKTMLSSLKDPSADSHSCIISADKCFVCQEEFKICLTQGYSDKVSELTCCGNNVHPKCFSQLQSSENWKGKCSLCRSEKCNIYVSNLYKSSLILDQFKYSHGLKK